MARFESSVFAFFAALILIAVGVDTYRVQWHIDSMRRLVDVQSRIAPAPRVSFPNAPSPCADLFGGLSNVWGVKHDGQTGFITIHGADVCILPMEPSPWRDSCAVGEIQLQGGQMYLCRPTERWITN